MKSNSKRWAAPLAIVASAAIFAVSAFAASGNLSAYNTFKESLISTMSKGDVTPENFTLTTTMNASYDNEQVMTARNVSKMQGEFVHSTNSVIESAGYSVDVATWDWTEGNTLFSVNKDENDVYHRYQYENMNFVGMDAYSYSHDESGPSNTEIQFVNALIDTLMGDTKNYFTADGDYIVVNLEGGQIPELIQLGTSLVMESITPGIGRGENLQLQQLENQLLSLKNHRIDAIYVRMLANDGENSYMSDTSFSVKLSGQDSNGIRHTLALDGSAVMSEKGSTIADPVVDLTGKTVVDEKMEDAYMVTIEEDGSTIRIDPDTSSATVEQADNE